MDKLKHIRRCGLSAFIITGIFCGCQNNTAHTKHERIDSSTAKSKSNYIRTYSLNVDSLTKDFSTFWDYWNSYLNFSKPFISYDENENKITKDEFFQKLLSARFLPVLIKEDDTSQYIQLKRIKLIANGSINRIIKQEADLHYRFYKMEGKQLPGFNFKDLDGNVYNNQNCVGKTLVINTWFVTCTACIHEMPDLNQLVDQYKDRNDVLFLGFCLDSPDKVKSFLTKIPFKYHLIPNSRVFVEEGLGIREYPTNILVNNKGNIVKAGIGALDLKVELNKLLDKK